MIFSFLLIFVKLIQHSLLLVLILVVRTQCWFVFIETRLKQNNALIPQVFYYSVSIFKSIGFEPDNAKWANLGCGCLNLFVAFFSPYLMEKCNRRPLMLLSCTCCSIFLVLLSICYSYSEAFTILPALCIVSLFGYIIFYQIGLGERCEFDFCVFFQY